MASAFFNVHLRRRIRAVTIENEDVLAGLTPVFAGAEKLGFAEPVIRGGAVRDALGGRAPNDYDLYVSRAQLTPGLKLPYIRANNADEFYTDWLQERLGLKDLKPLRPRITDRPYLAFQVRFAGVDAPVDLVINDEIISPEMLAVEADATMNGIAANRTRIAAHPLYQADTEQHIFRPTGAIIGNLISAPMRYRKKFAARDAQLQFRWF